MNPTLDYYNQNAEAFVDNTLNVDFTTTQDRFLDKLDQVALVLDFGCGSGRDAKYFMSRGYRVEATDGSEEICRMASENTGIEVKKLLFRELSESEKYDGIWACASILHLPQDELKEVLIKMLRALKRDGIIYTSFKNSDYEGVRNGRFFTDFTIDKFKSFIVDMDDIVIEEYWITGDVRPGREEEKWLNLILRKTNS